MPTLEQVLLLCKEVPQMLLNIEIKAPEDPEIFAKYEHQLLVSLVCQMINKHGVAKHTMISSFSATLLQDVVRASDNHHDFVIQSLRNGFGGPHSDDYAVHPQMLGVNIVYAQISPQLVQQLRQSEQTIFIGVWYLKCQSQEDATMYTIVFKTCSRIDFFYSDKPLEAMKARTAI